MGHLAGPASRAGEVSAKSMPLAISTSFRAAASGLGKRRSAVSFMRKMPIMVGSDPPPRIAPRLPQGPVGRHQARRFTLAPFVSPDLWHHPFTFRIMGRSDVATGTVKWFNATKGYGFIQPDKGGKDVFVHISAVEKAGLSSLNEGAKVSYEIVSDRGKESAGNLRVG